MDAETIFTVQCTIMVSNIRVMRLCVTFDCVHTHIFVHTPYNSESEAIRLIKSSRILKQQ